MCPYIDCSADSENILNEEEPIDIFKMSTNVIGNSLSGLEDHPGAASNVNSQTSSTWLASTSVNSVKINDTSSKIADTSLNANKTVREIFSVAVSSIFQQPQQEQHQQQRTQDYNLSVPQILNNEPPSSVNNTNINEINFQLGYNHDALVDVIEALNIMFSSLCISIQNLDRALDNLNNGINLNNTQDSSESLNDSSSSSSIISSPAAPILDASAPSSNISCPQTLEIETLLNVLLPYLSHIEILSRFEYNRDALLKHGGLSNVVNIFSIASTLYTRTNSSLVESDTILETLQNILIYSEIIICNSIDSEKLWMTYVTTCKPNSMNNLKKSPKDATQSHESLCVNIFEILSSLIAHFYCSSKFQSAASNKISQLRLVTLNTLGSLLINRYYILQEHDLMQCVGRCIFDSLRIPPWISELYPHLDPCFLRNEFRCQLISLSCMLFCSTSSLLLKAEREFFWANISKVKDMMIWVSACMADLSDSDYSSQKVWYPNFPYHQSCKFLTTSVICKIIRSDFEPLQCEELNLIIYLLYRAISDGYFESADNSIDTGISVEEVSSWLEKLIRVIATITSREPELSPAMSNPSSPIQNSLLIMDPNNFRKILLSKSLGFEKQPYQPLLQLSFVDFLQRIIEPAYDNEANSLDALYIRRRICLELLEKLDVWRLLYGHLFFRKKNDTLHGIKAAVVDFTAAVGHLPWMPKIGPVKYLLNVVKNSKEQEMYDDFDEEFRETCVNILASMITSPDATGNNKLYNKNNDDDVDGVKESWKQLRFLDDLIPILFSEVIASKQNPGFVDPTITPSNPLKIAIFEYISKLITSSVSMALYVADHNSFRSNLFEAISLFKSLSPLDIDPIIDRYMYLIVLISCHCFLSQPIHSRNRKIDLENPLLPQIARNFIAYYFSLFPNSLNDIHSLHLQLFLLDGIRRMLQFFPPGSKERSLVRSGLISSRVFENMLALFHTKVCIHKEEDSIKDPSSNVKSLKIVTDKLKQPKLVDSPNTTHYHHLCQQVFLTLSALLSGSNIARNCFKSMNGYEEIKSIIITKNGWEPWKELLDLIICLLVPKLLPGDFTEILIIEITPSVLKNHIIQNPDAVDALISLYPCYVPDIQFYILDVLESLASGHEINKLLLSKAGLPKKLLKKVIPISSSVELLEKSVKVFEVLLNNELKF